MADQNSTELSPDTTPSPVLPPIAEAPLVSCFSLVDTSEQDRKRYKIAAGGFFIAAIIIIFGVLFGVPELLKKIAPDNKELVPAWDLAKDYSGWIWIFSGLFIISTVVPFFSKKLRHFTGTLCNLLSFTVLAAIMSFFVHGSGGLGSSLYGTPFLALLSIALFVPEDRLIRILMFVITVILGILVVCYVAPEKQPHDFIVLLLSTLSFGFANAVKSSLNRFS